MTGVGSITNVATGIVSSGLVLHLDAGNAASYPGSGTVWTDLSGNGKNGTLTNGPTYTSADGGAIVFDGVDDYVDFGNILFNNVNTVTISIWVKMPSMVTNKYIMSKGSAGDGISTFICYTGSGPSGGSSSYIRFSMGNEFGSNSTNLEIANLNWGQWYNFTFTYDGSFVKGYKNGTTSGSTSLSGNLYTTIAPLYLARSKYGDNASCTIGNFTIYNRALSEIEVTQNFNALRGRVGL